VPERLTSHDVYVPDPVIDDTVAVITPVEVLYESTTPFIRLFASCAITICWPGMYARPWPTPNVLDPTEMVSAVTELVE
jgi:hypothetical protein